MRISKKEPYNWFAENFGIGGFENYTLEQVRDVLKAMNLILENCGNAELEFLGKFLIKLSENPVLARNFLNKIIEKSY